MRVISERMFSSELLIVYVDTEWTKKCRMMEYFLNLFYIDCLFFLSLCTSTVAVYPENKKKPMLANVNFKLVSAVQFQFSILPFPHILVFAKQFQSLCCLCRSFFGIHVSTHFSAPTANRNAFKFEMTINSIDGKSNI